MVGPELESLRGRSCPCKVFLGKHHSATQVPGVGSTASKVGDKTLVGTAAVVGLVEGKSFKQATLEVGKVVGIERGINSKLELGVVKTILLELSMVGLVGA